MFESTELKHKLSDKDYDAEVPKLREALLNAQFDLLEKKDRSLLIIVGGVEGAGKGDTINLLSSWLDPRYLDIHALSAHSDEERARPEYYRHFRRLPPKGKIGVHFGSACRLWSMLLSEYIVFKWMLHWHALTRWNGFSRTRAGSYSSYGSTCRKSNKKSA